MYRTWFVEEFVKNEPVSRKGFVFLADGLMVGCLIRVYLLARVVHYLNAAYSSWVFWAFHVLSIA